MNKDCKIVKKRSKRRILIVTLLILSTIVAGVVVFFSRNVNPVIESVANEKIRAVASEAVSTSVLDVMREHPAVDYLTVVRDEQNKIKSVDINTDIINFLAQEITLDAQKNINEAGQCGIDIPLGSLSGIMMLTGVGPNVNIKLYLVGSTRTKIISEFTDTGINQTSHKLYIDIEGSVSVAVPGVKSNIKTSTYVLMSETIIIGDVPNTYLHAATVGDMMDLVTS